MWKNNHPKMTCDSAIGQHLTTNIEIEGLEGKVDHVERYANGESKW